MSRSEVAAQCAEGGGGSRGSIAVDAVLRTVVAAAVGAVALAAADVDATGGAARAPARSLKLRSSKTRGSGSFRALRSRRRALQRSRNLPRRAATVLWAVAEVLRHRLRL
jgi:hypothetical protein